MKNHVDAMPRQNVLDAIGNTPLVQLHRFLDEPSVTLFTKMEMFNPGGSAKDRPARQMIEQALQSGRIGPRTTIVESSSGNMGIGLAQVCRYYGLPFICVVDPHAQSQNIAIIKALGGTIERVTQKREGSYLAARWQRVGELVQAMEDAWWPNQYANPDNPTAHFAGTIAEIDESLSGNFDYLFVATSSTGTAQGCRDYLETKGRRAKVIAVDAEGSVLFGGPSGERHIPGLGAGVMPDLASGQSFDKVHRVSDLDCVRGCRAMAQREAILVGGSAGGVLAVIRRMQKQLRNKTCVAIVHDSGTRYLDTVYNDQWVRETLGGKFPLEEVDDHSSDRKLTVATHCQTCLSNRSAVLTE